MIHDRGNIAQSGSCEAVVCGLMYADYHPFLRQGAGERYCRAHQQHTLGNLLFPSPPPSSLPLRNQAGPGLRRTEPHSALLIDKTPWKKRTANYRPDLRHYVTRSARELDFWDASRLKRHVAAGKSEVKWILSLLYIKDNGTPLE